MFFTIEIIWVDGHNPYLLKGKNDNIFLNILYSCNSDINICIIYFLNFIFTKEEDKNKMIKTPLSN